nr:DNA alkylation repair protein [Galbibacter mesophilus]
MAALQEIGDKEFADGLKRFGIESRQALGVKVPELRRIARSYKNDHELALELWESPIHEMKILATIIANPKKVTEKQADKWTADLYSWDLCDQLSVNLLSKSALAKDLVLRYIDREQEFVKRTAFVLIASLATKDKVSENEIFQNYIFLVATKCDDNRNFVKKAAQWALKNIGKRNTELAEDCIKTCQKLILSNSKTQQWIGRKTISDLNKFYHRKSHLH